MAVLLRGRFLQEVPEARRVFGTVHRSYAHPKNGASLMLNANTDVDTLSENVPNVYRNLLGRRPQLIGPHLQLTVLDA